MTYMSAEMTDEQLIANFLAGDDYSLSRLILRHLKPVYNFILRMTGNSGDAEDITQETFVKVWRNIRKYKAGRNFRSWIFSIARNTAIDFFRKKKEAPFSNFENEYGENSLEENLTSPDPLPDEILGKAMEKSTIADLLQKLSPAQREVLLLHYAEDLTFEEIGGIVRAPMNTIKSHHRRALETLRRLLD